MKIILGQTHFHVRVRLLKFALLAGSDRGLVEFLKNEWDYLFREVTGEFCEDCRHTKWGMIG